MKSKIYFATKETYENYQTTHGRLLYEWDFIETLSQATSFRNVSVFIELDNAVLFVPLLERKALNLYSIAFSLPFGLYGGFLPIKMVSNKNINQVVLSELRSFIKRDIVIQNVLSDKEFSETGLIPIMKTFTHAISIKDKTRENIFKETFPGELRNQIRKSKKSNLDVRSGNNIELTNDFFELYVLSNQRWGKKKLKYTINFFKSFLSKTYFEIKIAYYNNRPVSGIILLKLLNRYQYWFGAMNKEYGKYCPNHLLISNSIEEAIDLRYEVFDFGASGGHGQLQEVIKFKESFGAIRIPYSVYFYGNDFIKFGLSIAMNMS